MIGKAFPMLTIWLFMVSLLILKCKLLWDAFWGILGWDTRFLAGYQMHQCLP